MAVVLSLVGSSRFENDSLLTRHVRSRSIFPTRGSVESCLKFTERFRCRGMRRESLIVPYRLIERYLKFNHGYAVYTRYKRLTRLSPSNFLRPFFALLCGIL